MFSLIFLHLFLYGCNIFMWRKTRINYSFIFELCSTKELKYRDVFLICTMSMTAVVGVLFIHISLMAKGYSYTQLQIIPGLLLLVICRIYNFMTNENVTVLFSVKYLDIMFSLLNFHVYRFLFYYLCVPSTLPTNRAVIVCFVY